MPQIRPIEDLKNTNDISSACHSSREPIFITENGTANLVIMSIETYEEMLGSTIAERAVSEAEDEYASGGQLREAKTALSSLKRKHFG